MSSQQRAILVTGAAGDIGAAIGRRLRSDGFHVIASDLRPRPPDCPPEDWIGADLSRLSGVADLAKSVAAPLYGLVHAAGVILSQALEEATERDWDLSYAVNVKAAFFLARDLAPAFSNPSSVVMIGSVAGQRASPENLVYASSKAALRNLAASLAVAMAKRGTRVNVVAPGLIATGTSDIATDELSRLRGRPRDEVWRARVAGIPQERPGSVDEVANAVAWLMSDQSSDVTGATIAVNGGLLAGM
ncbi:MAG: SDR family oxidoreductase [Methylocystis sp.]